MSLIGIGNSKKSVLIKNKFQINSKCFVLLHSSEKCNFQDLIVRVSRVISSFFNDQIKKECI